jgi:TIR domain
MAKAPAPRGYRVFISHASDDIWVAEQIARRIEDCGATCFLDVRDIAAGDDFRARIRKEMPECDELLALFTPWSRRRVWVHNEIGMADAADKRIVAVFYKVAIDDFRNDGDSLGVLQSTNIVAINQLDSYFQELKKRVR